MSKPNMKKLVNPQDSIFEEIKRVDENGAEYWSARDMAKVLEYLEYRNFLPVIKKAKEACANSQHKVEDHFVDMHDMIEIGKGGKRPVETVKLSRYACYLIVQNADPSKKVVANGQTYFAVQTRIAEIQQMDEYNRLTDEEEKRLFLRHQLAHHNSLLAETAKNAGVVESRDYAIFQCTFV